MEVSRLAFTAVGAVETLIGAYVLLFPEPALPAAVGRFLSVGAVSSSPALLPTLAQTGALRLALGCLVLAAAVGSPGIKDHALYPLEAAVAVHACVQIFAAASRSHPRLPVSSGVLLALAEGAAIVGGMAADLGFDLDAATDSPAFLAALGALGVGLLLALLTTFTKACSGAKVGDDGSAAPSATGGTPLLFDENKHKLSPSARRLLS